MRYFLAQDTKTLERDKNGNLISHVWPGGYPVVYIVADGGELCPACANGENHSDASVETDSYQWLLIGSVIHWEGEPILCSHCYAQIESAYGNPEKED